MTKHTNALIIGGIALFALGGYVGVVLSKHVIKSITDALNDINFN